MIEALTQIKHRGGFGKKTERKRFLLILLVGR